MFKSAFRADGTAQSLHSVGTGVPIVIGIKSGSCHTCLPALLRRSYAKASRQVLLKSPDYLFSQIFFMPMHVGIPILFS